MLKKLFTAKLVCLLISASVLNASASETMLKKAIASLGYKITGEIAAAGADWELRDFKMRSKRIFSVKSTKKVPGEKNLYYRFAVTIEEYGTEEDAQKRLAHIESTPPGPDSKLIAPEYALREGFRRGKEVYVVSTNVYTFVADKSLSRFRENLKTEMAKHDKCFEPNSKCK